LHLLEPQHERDDQRQAIAQVREGLIDQLETLYRRPSHSIGAQDLAKGPSPGPPAYLLWRSREAAITGRCRREIRGLR